jgi:hypothetical protein
MPFSLQPCYEQLRVDWQKRSSFHSLLLLYKVEADSSRLVSLCSNPHKGFTRLNRHLDMTGKMRLGMAGKMNVTYGTNCGYRGWGRQGGPVDEVQESGRRRWERGGGGEDTEEEGHGKGITGDRGTGRGDEERGGGSVSCGRGMGEGEQGRRGAKEAMEDRQGEEAEKTLPWENV